MVWNIDHQLKISFYYVVSQRANKPPSGLPIQEIRAQMMKSSGPVITCRSFLNTATARYRRINREEFLGAANSLTSYGKIHKVKIPGQQMHSIVYVKKPPSELKDTDGLCTMEEYRIRYMFPTPKSIGKCIRAQLVKLGMVSEMDLNGVPE